MASTIVDLTGPQPRLLRRGAISVGRLREVAAVAAGADAGRPDREPPADVTCVCRQLAFRRGSQAGALELRLMLFNPVQAR